MRSIPDHLPLRLTGPRALATLVLSCAILLTGCSGSGGSTGASENSASPVPEGSPGATGSATPPPLTAPTGSWTPPAKGATAGPTAPAAVPTRSAALHSPVALDTRVTVNLVAVSATTVKAVTPGENSGPAVKVTVSVQNRSTAPIDVNSAVVSLTADKGAAGVGTTAGNSLPLKGSVAPGATAKGTYIFMLAPAKGRQVSVSVNYSAGEPVAVFTGRTA